MKKVVSIFAVAMMSAMMFAASFKNGQTVYVSKDGGVTAEPKSSKVVGNVVYGDSGKVLDFDKKTKKYKIQVADSSIVGWFEEKNLTKKKIVKESTVNTVADNIALAGKGSVSAKSTKAKSTKAKSTKSKSSKKNKTKTAAAEESPFGKTE